MVLARAEQPDPVAELQDQVGARQELGVAAAEMDHGVADAARHREGRELEPDHALPGDEDPQVVEVGAVLGHAHGHQLAQHAAGGLQQGRGLGLDQEHVVLVQDELVARHQVAVLLADGGDHDARGQPGRQLRQVRPATSGLRMAISA